MNELLIKARAVELIRDEKRRRARRRCQLMFALGAAAAAALFGFLEFLL